MHDVLLREIQRRLEQLSAAFSRVESRMAAAEQSQQKQWGLMPPQSSGSGGTQIFQAQTPSSGSWAASGTFAYTPDSFTASVYTLDGSPTVVTSSATVYYHSTTVLESSTVVLVKLNADNATYSVINVVC